MQLASPFVQKQLVARNLADRKRKLWDYIRDNIATGMAWALFEEAWHQLIQNKGLPNFKMLGRRLHDNEERIVTVQGALDSVVVQRETPAKVRSGRYYQPKSKTFVAVDGWSAQGFFQVTMARRHHIAPGGATSQFRKVLAYLHKENGGAPVRFFFVVPKAVFFSSSYTLQQWVYGCALSAAS